MTKAKSTKKPSALVARSHPAAALYTHIRELIVAARQTVVRGVDLVQVHTNYQIGRHIVEHEQQGKGRAVYGAELLTQLSEKLIREFGRGYAKSNLEYMRKFFLMYKDRISPSMTGELTPPEKSQSLAGKFPSLQKSQSPTGQSSPFSLSWTHYVFLLGIKDSAERSFYEIEATNQNWTVREIKRQFDSSLYERLALSRDKDGIRKLAQRGQIINQPQDLLKEPMVLEFLGLDEQARYSESDLESAIITRIEQFLLELGKGFLFEARQKRFTLNGDHFFVDLVFYNRLLRCYVLVDLKIGRLTHQDLGQMQMYVNYFDRHVRTAGENATIGIILCKKKTEALVEITLPGDANIHAREYKLYLPSKEELRRKLQEWITKG